jgi:hypothetical protein
MMHLNKLFFRKKETKAGLFLTNKTQKRAIRIFISFVITCLFSQNIAFSQNTLDIFSVSGRMANPQDYEQNINEKARESGSIIGLTLPVPLSDRTIIYSNLNYLYFNIRSNPGLSSKTGTFNNLHGIILRTGIIKKIDDKQRIQFLLAPRLIGDLNSFDKDNWQIGAIALYDKKFNSNLSLGFGAMFNAEYFGPYLIPLINLNAQLSDKLSISGLLPVNLKIKCQGTEKFAFGFNHFGLTTSYRLNNDENAGDYVERQSIDLSFFAEYNVAKNIFAEAKIGRTFNRSYKQFDADQKVDFAIPLKNFGDDRIAKNLLFDNGLFAELKLIYRIKIE